MLWAWNRVKEVSDPAEGERRDGQTGPPRPSLGAGPPTVESENPESARPSAALKLAPANLECRQLPGQGSKGRKVRSERRGAGMRCLRKKSYRSCLSLRLLFQYTVRRNFHCQSYSHCQEKGPPARLELRVR